MRDPEMCFELAKPVGGNLSLDPFYWRNDYVAVEQFSRSIVRGHYVALLELHRQHQQFALQWDSNLRMQGFLEAFSDKSHSWLVRSCGADIASLCPLFFLPPLNRSKGASTMETAILNATEYRNVSLSLLNESKTNPRRIFEDAALKELAESIRSQGVLSPLLVRPLTEKSFEIVAGARRFRAAQIAEVPTVPVRIVNLSDAEALEAQLIELSIVGKSFLFIHAARYVVYM